MDDTISVDSSNKNEILDADQTIFTSKEKLFYRMVDKYFKNTSPENIKIMCEMIELKYKISLRLLDWFITGYSYSNCICYELDGMELGDNFNVHISYKAQLKSYKKKYFDPFRRRKRFYYYYDKNDKTKKICTTIGQLNFFRWAFTYGIIKYVQEHFDEITNALINVKKETEIAQKNKVKEVSKTGKENEVGKTGDKVENKTENKTENKEINKKSGLSNPSVTLEFD